MQGISLNLKSNCKAVAGEFFEVHLKAGTKEDPTNNGKVVALSLIGCKIG
jgi:hypothetical protein